MPNLPNKGKTRRDNNGNLTQPATPKFVDIDWIDVIEEIRIDKNCSDYEKRLLRDSINRLLQEKQNTVSPEYFQNRLAFLHLNLEKINKKGIPKGMP